MPSQLQNSPAERRLAAAIAEAVAGDERKLHRLLCRDDPFFDGAYALISHVRDALLECGMSGRAHDAGRAMQLLRGMVINSEKLGTLKVPYVMNF